MNIGFCEFAVYLICSSTGFPLESQIVNNEITVVFLTILMYSSPINAESLLYIIKIIDEN